MAAPSSVVENRRLVDRVALSDYFISTSAICQTPYEASFLPPPHPPSAFVSCLSPPYRKVISPRPRSRNVRDWAVVKWMDGSSGTFYPILEFKVSLLSNRSRIVDESIVHGAYFEA